MCYSMLSLKFFVYSKYHSAHSEIEIREGVKWLLTRGENNWKIIKISGPKNGHRRLQEVVVY